jgi:hypothetical protein
MLLRCWQLLVRISYRSQNRANAMADRSIGDLPSTIQVASTSPRAGEIESPGNVLQPLAKKNPLAPGAGPTIC